jgi:hypothetical protein
MVPVKDHCWRILWNTEHGLDWLEYSTRSTWLWVCRRGSPNFQRLEFYTSLLPTIYSKITTLISYSVMREVDEWFEMQWHWINMVLDATSHGTNNCENAWSFILLKEEKYFYQLLLLTILTSVDQRMWHLNENANYIIRYNVLIGVYLTNHGVLDFN